MDFIDIVVDRRVSLLNIIITANKNSVKYVLCNCKDLPG